MSAYLLDWLSLFGRWLHLVAGIAWIGSSFYFIWLDNHLVPPADPAIAARGVAGELWAVHGGGFYNSHKYRLAPPSLPPSLHWFYWEAYATFLSGLFLLCLLYYVQAEVYLIDPAVAALAKPAAIALGVAFLPAGWLVYHGLCRSPLARNGRLLGAVLAILLSIAAWALCHLFSGRGGKGRKVAAKYANPDDLSETWTGRGRKPRWLTAKLKAGDKIEKFLLK